MKRSHGFRSKSRNKLSGGRFSIAEALQEFKKDDKVRININPAVHKGMPHPKYQGSLGRVTSKRGRSFIVEIRDQKKLKTITAKPEHLRAEKIQ